MIYFIESGTSGFVKIGYCSGDPNARLAQLQCGNPEPLRLLAVRDGDKDAEAHFHSKFAHLRVRGEWFRWCAEIKEWAAPLLADPDDVRKARAEYARDLIAGRTSSREVYERMLFGGVRPWSAKRRAEFAAKGAEIERLSNGL